eukprot:2104361-Pyramimonas_sp.AAC.1
MEVRESELICSVCQCQASSFDDFQTRVAGHHPGPYTVRFGRDENILGVGEEEEGGGRGRRSRQQRWGPAAIWERRRWQGAQA